MKELFDKVSAACSKITTKEYSTSFSLGISVLGKSIQAPIYGIYGFVRLADEIVDTFIDFDTNKLIDDFKIDTYKAIENKISLNPILNSFQHVVNTYQIEHELIDRFLESMVMDLDKKSYNQEEYERYILGSAEVVGLMCLRVFVTGNTEQYLKLKPFAMKLGAAFQKINFLRDLKADYQALGRVYFPNVDMTEFNNSSKTQIEQEIALDFNEALEGIKLLPASSRFGVYLAYSYYLQLFYKIKKLKAKDLLTRRIRVSNFKKFQIMIWAMLRIKMNAL